MCNFSISFRDCLGQPTSVPRCDRKGGLRACFSSQPDSFFCQPSGKSCQPTCVACRYSCFHLPTGTKKQTTDTQNSRTGAAGQSSPTREGHINYIEREAARPDKPVNDASPRRGCAFPLSFRQPRHGARRALSGGRWQRKRNGLSRRCVRCQPHGVRLFCRRTPRCRHG